jgi:polar amino acid transport system substrate-binding protein
MARSRRAPAAAAFAAAALLGAFPAAAQDARGMSYGLDDMPSRYEILRVAVEPAQPPFQFIDQAGRPAGFFVDVVNAVGAAGGMAVSLYVMDGRSARAALASGDVDVILGAPYTYGAADALAAVDLTEPLFASAIAVVSRVGDGRYADGVARLTDGVLALTSGSPAYDFLKAIRAVHFNETNSPADALELLALGRADAMLEDRAVSSYLLRGRGDRNDFELASSYWLPVEYGMAVRRGDDFLLYKLNQGLGSIKESGAYSAAHERWFDDSEQAVKRRLRYAMMAFAAVLATLVLGGGGTVWWNRQLASRVRSSTAELRAANEELGRLVGEAEDKKEFIAQILESSPRGLVTLGTDGVVSVCNARARAIGLLNPDPTGRPYSEYPFLERFLSAGRLERVLSGESFPFESVSWERPDGARLHIRNGLYPQVDHERNVVGAILSFEDHTVEKAMMDRLAERDKDEALGRIVAGIAHEIRNPLTSIKAFVELLPRKMDDPRFMREMGAYVPREVERVDKLIRDLIDFAKPRKPVRAVVDVGALVESCVALAAPGLAKRGVTVGCAAEKGSGAFVDADQVRQCAMNLLLNAADAVEESRAGSSGAAGRRDGPDIAVRVESSAGRVKVTFRDSGGGMDAAELARVFEPFYTTKRGGVGLGLPLSRQYIEENGGRLDMTSAAGQGTTVVMEFPPEGHEGG